MQCLYGAGICLAPQRATVVPGEVCEEIMFKIQDVK
jgi:hypothetical protein